MYYGSTVMRATITQAESRTLWTDSSGSQSQSQPSAHTDLAGGISTLRTDWNLRYTRCKLSPAWDYLLPSFLIWDSIHCYHRSAAMTEEKLDTAYTPILDFVMVMKTRESRTFCAIIIMNITLFSGYFLDSV